MKVEPVALQGSRVRLEPIEPRHRAAYIAAGLLDLSIYRWMPSPWRTAEECGAFFDDSLRALERGERIMFVTIDQASGQIVGSTSMCAIDPVHRRLEIGYTWIVPGFQRSHINTEAKYLQLKHSFETLGCIRVELKTDALNERSRAAIARIGGKQEGILRHHMICRDGRLRDTVYFSILAEEWPASKVKLEEMMR